MSITGDVVIYQMNLEEMTGEEFESEVLQILKTSKEFVTVSSLSNTLNSFFDIEAEQILEGNKRIRVGFYLKRGQVLTRDVVDYIYSGWSALPVRRDKLCLVTLGSVQATAGQLAQKYGIEIWSIYTLYQYRYPNSRRGKRLESREENLSAALSALAPGKLEWATYQKLSCDIFSHLFCPPLELPRFEKTDADKRNRRDMIFENSTDSPYWRMLRGLYKADYIVVDAKNYNEPIGKQPVLDIAHYLKSYGCGLFAVILTRKGADESALHAIREQWTSSSKMIIVLDDTDLLDMLRMKASGTRPEELIRVKIADFRMGL